MNAMNNEVAYALGAFERWMNRPLARVQVYTWHLANELDANCPSIRLLQPYRDEVNRKFRWRLAQKIKLIRHVSRIELPRYSESTGNYIHAAAKPVK